MSLGIGFIGAGGIARLRHGPGLQAIDGVELVAVANRSQESGRAFANQFGVARVYSNWRALLDDDDVDAVVIGTWPYLHSKLSIAALDAGKHVFCQARLAMDAADARRMVAAKQAAGKTTMVCPPPHGMRFAERIKSIVSNGELGRIFHLTVRDFTPAYCDPQTALHWRQSESRSGANTLTLGIVYEVLLTWFGIRANWVQAGDATFVNDRPDGDSLAPVERPDAVFVTAGLENGGLASIALSGVAGGRTVGSPDFGLRLKRQSALGGWPSQQRRRQSDVIARSRLAIRAVRTRRSGRLARGTRFRRGRPGRQQPPTQLGIGP